jgi:hypothetical protein
VDYSTSLFDLRTEILRFFRRKGKLLDGNTNVFDGGIQAVRYSKLVLRLLACPYLLIVSESSMKTVWAVVAVGGFILRLGLIYD